MDPKTRKRALSMIPCGLSVVGVRHGDERSAFTTTWLSQCSIRPPQVMLAVRIDSTGHAMIEECGTFTVSLLESGQKEIAGRFFKRPHVEGDTMNGVKFRDGSATGCPILTDAPAHLECRVSEAMTGGDHTVFVGEVVEVGAEREAAPLTLEETGWSYG